MSEKKGIRGTIDTTRAVVGLVKDIALVRDLTNWCSGGTTWEDVAQYWDWVR